MTELAVPSHVPTPATIGQATAVEQARAEAEVKAAVVVAQQCPRNVAGARAQMIESCEQVELAQRAFFRYRRAGSNITGPTIHLARELARCWGNVQYGIAELRRDDVAGESEMMAFAWDVQTNTRSSSTFIVPHIRDKQGGGQRLTETRDIYENNANMGARRVREAIFAILPPWFTEQAKAVCSATIERGDGTPLADRIANLISGYDRAGVTKRQLEDKVGLRSENWTAKDVAALTVIWRSLVARETTRAEEFPDSTPEADATAAAPDRMRSILQTSGSESSATTHGGDADAASPAPESPPLPSSEPGPVPLNTRSNLARAMFAAINEAGITEAERLPWISGVIGREISSSKEMFEDDARRVLDALAPADSEVAQDGERA